MESKIKELEKGWVFEYLPHNNKNQAMGISEYYEDCVGAENALSEFETAIINNTYEMHIVNMNDDRYKYNYEIITNTGICLKNPRGYVVKYNAEKSANNLIKYVKESLSKKE